MKLFRGKQLFSISIAALLSLWILSSSMHIINPVFFPEIQSFLAAGKELFIEKSFLADVGISTFRVISAFTLALFMAIPLALLMNSYKTLHALVSPYIDFVRYLPVPALIPLTILFFGIGESAKISLLFIGTFFQMILLILDDLDNVPKQYINLSFTLNFSKLQTLKAKLLCIAPQLFDNSRITLGWCWTYLVIAELVAANSGIGYTIKEAQRFSNIPNLYIGIATIGAIGFLTDYAFKKCYPYIFKYKI